MITLDSSTMGSNVTLGADGLTFTIANHTGGVRATEGKETGKWYWEIEGTDVSSMVVGVTKESQSLKSQYYNTTDALVGIFSNDLKMPEMTKTGVTFKTGDVIGICLNLDDKNVTFYKNGQNTGLTYPITYTEKVYPTITAVSSGGARSGKINFGDSEFIYIPNDVPLDTKRYNGEKLIYFKKLIIKNPTTNQHYSLAEKTLIHLSNASDKNMILYGLESGTEVKLDEPFTKHIYVEYDEATDTHTETEVEVPEGFSVYDYISEAPEVLVYTESTDDITVSTTTDPFDIYDEFGDSVEALYYTGDETATEVDLILEANWSPIDELDGDFEVVTWTDEPQETAQRVLEMTAIPKPQFIKLVNSKRVYGVLESILSNDVSVGYRDEARYFITGLDTTKWYVWDKALNKFVVTDTSTHEMVTKNGMKHTDINNITQAQWNTWSEQHINVGIFLKDNPRDTITSIVENISYKDFLPRDSTTISEASLYILNTTAKIDLEMNGSLLTGVLSDDDLTRVQYRVSLNGNFHYPKDGSWTSLGESPQNISLAFSSSDINIDNLNTVKVEFRDFFGTIDYWQNQFIGTYSGLMFKDIYGEYYSSEIGEVLQYLDFGIIIAGQTTIEHEIILKNQYGYDVENVHLHANTANFPQGMSIEFSKSLSPFLPQPDLKLNGVLKHNEELSFFIRLKSTLGVTPDANGSFDIVVKADKVKVV